MRFHATIKNFAAALSVVLIASIMPIVGHAETAPANNPNDGGKIYTVLPIPSKHQEKGVTNYISVVSGQDAINEKIQFEVTNKTDKPITLNVTPLNAYTSPNGAIQYTEKLEEAQSRLLDENYAMKEKNYIEIADKLTLAPKESKVVSGSLQVDANAAKIQGSVLGGVAFQLFEKGDAVQQEESQFRINNEMNTVVGVMATFTERTDDNKIQFEFGEPFVEPMPAYYGIRLPVAFDSSVLLQNVSFEYEVLDEKNKQLFAYKVKPEQARMFNFSPKSHPNVLFPWDHDDIQKNTKYTLKGVLKYTGSDKKEQRVPFEKTFEFGGKDWNGNTASPNSPTMGGDGGFNYWWLLLLIPLALLAWYILRKRNDLYVYHNESDVPETMIIKHDSELFDRVVPAREVKDFDYDEYNVFDDSDHEAFTHKHFYKKAKDANKNVEYRYDKTETIE